MHAFIGVLDHPYFAVSKDDGSFEIKNLPPGTYTIGVWQEKLGTQEQQVTVPPTARLRPTSHSRKIIHAQYRICSFCSWSDSVFLPAATPPKLRSSLRKPRRAETSEPRIYVTNEVGGDLTVIGSGNYNVLATVPLGKRPRGIHPARPQDDLRGAERLAHCRARCG
jgi:YVTN family beta-propeller protein